MATLDLSLAAMRFAGLRNFHPEFGTKEANDTGVSTENMCRNFMLPFTKQRPVEVSENSDTGQVEADTRLVFTNSGITLDLSAATFAGCKAEISAAFASGSASVTYEGANGTETVKLAPNAGVMLLADANLKWKVFLYLQGSNVINVISNEYEKGHFLYAKVFGIKDRNSETDYKTDITQDRQKLYLRRGRFIPFHVEGVGMLKYIIERDTDLDDVAIDDDTMNGHEAGKDYFIYLVYSPSLFGGRPNNLGFIKSLNDPDGISLYGNSNIHGTSANAIKPYPEISGEALTAENCLCVGGYNTLCADVTEENVPAHALAHPAEGYSAGDIIPFSVWDLYHRPKSSPVGTAYNPNLDLWADEYFLCDRKQALTGTAGTYGGEYPEESGIILMPAFGKKPVAGADSEGGIYGSERGAQIMAFMKKRFMTVDEYTQLSLGSPQGVNIQGSAKPEGAGGHLATNGKRITSYGFLEDMCGVYDFWGANFGASNSGNSWANNFSSNDSDVAGQRFAEPTRVLLGGYWGDGADCGSRFRRWDAGAWHFHAYIALRGVSEPMRHRD